MPKRKCVLLGNKTGNTEQKHILLDDKNHKNIDKNEQNTSQNEKNTDKKQRLLSDILGYFFDSAERNNLNNEKVNKVVKDVQYLFKKDPKQRDIKCFICEND